MKSKVTQSSESESTMGRWNMKNKKQPDGHRKAPANGRAKVYVAIPPPTGWPGGSPEDNGWKGTFTK